MVSFPVLAPGIGAWGSRQPEDKGNADRLPRTRGTDSFSPSSRGSADSFAGLLGTVRSGAGVECGR